MSQRIKQLRERNMAAQRFAKPYNWKLLVELMIIYAPIVWAIFSDTDTKVLILKFTVGTDRNPMRHTHWIILYIQFDSKNMLQNLSVI